MKMTRSKWEIVAVVATAVLHPVFIEIVHQRATFIGLALGGWLLYLGARAWRQRDIPALWGFRREGFGPAFAATSVFGFVALVGMARIAIDQQTLNLTRPMLALLFLYPIWGLLQQLLVQGVFVRTMTLENRGGRRVIATTAIASLLFGAVHLPEIKLAFATALLGAVFTLIYIRWRNLWALGLYHGWLGVFFYYWVLGRDPWAEVFLGHT